MNSELDRQKYYVVILKASFYYYVVGHKLLCVVDDEKICKNQRIIWYCQIYMQWDRILNNSNIVIVAIYIFICMWCEWNMLSSLRL